MFRFGPIARSIIGRPTPREASERYSKIAIASRSACCKRRIQSSYRDASRCGRTDWSQVSSSTLNAGALGSRGAAVAFSSNNSKRSVSTCPLLAASQTAVRPSYVRKQHEKTNELSAAVVYSFMCSTGKRTKDTNAAYHPYYKTETQRGDRNEMEQEQKEKGEGCSLSRWQRSRGRRQSWTTGGVTTERKEAQRETIAGTPCKNAQMLYTKRRKVSEERRALIPYPGRSHPPCLPEPRRKHTSRVLPGQRSLEPSGRPTCTRRSVSIH